MDSPNSGWISVKDRLPAQEDGDEYGYVFVWHAYQGVMLTAWNQFRNRFYAYWMPTKHITADLWIKATERKPTKADADTLNCVLAKNTHEGIKVTGWHQFDLDSAFTEWLPLPEPPSDFRELRKRA